MFFKRYLLATTFVALALPAAAFAQRKPSRTTRPAARPTAVKPAAKPAAQAGAVTLTPQDMALVIDGLNFPPNVRARLGSDAAERKAFAKDIRQMLAVAEEARAAGFAARPELALQLELSRSFVIAQAYFRKQQEAGATGPEQVVSQAEIDAFVKEPGQDKQFEAFVEDYRKNGPTKGAPVSDERRAELLQHWGRVMTGKRKAIAAGVDRERKTELVVMLQQARLLEGAYTKELSTRFKATDAEVDAYLASHPEFDTKEARAKIDALLKRARAGEDFSALAREFSTDPGSREQGGDLGWFGRGVMVKPFEDTAFGLKVGEISEVFESPFGFHIVKLEERRPPAVAGAGSSEQVRARHILIPYNSRPRRSDAPPQSPRDEARTAVELEKRERIFGEIATRRRVTVPDDYPVEVSAVVPADGGGGTQAGAQTATRPAASKPKPPASATAPKKQSARRP
ncbi:MAG TPA: peptidylprolyl isomerase [Pyrinomonadaceae bacterium]|nr:peptidylprolyl isomerase [Pyrinomonadaceae bacterium]